MLRWACLFFVCLVQFLIPGSTLFSEDQKLPPTTNLIVSEGQIKVKGRSATVYTLQQPDGTWGLRTKSDQPFNVILQNKLNTPTSIHWHGLILPDDQDGVAFITQFPIYPGLSYHYQFPLRQEGTFWMHSHFGLQEQLLLNAPLIIAGPDDASIADQEAVILLNDFTFKSPLAVLEGLRCRNQKMSMHADNKSRTDIVDVNYDAFLANRKTLEDPEIIEVMPGKKVRLRIINGASSTNFFLFLGYLEGEAIAVDGSRTKPLRGSTFELAVAQRIDVVVKIPEKGGAYPILAQGEGTDMLAGVVLTTKGAASPKLSLQTTSKAGPLTNEQEKRLEALHPLPRKQPEQKVVLELGGNMQTYTWTINGQAWPEVTPVVVKEGQRVEIAFKNTSKMSHPMHLHGHVFQVTAIDGKEIDGAVRDTILVTPGSTVTIQFDADNAGVWPLHCHLLYHSESGMLTVVRYENFIQPLRCTETK